MNRSVIFCLIILGCGAVLATTAETAEDQSGDTSVPDDYNELNESAVTAGDEVQLTDAEVETPEDPDPVDDPHRIIGGQPITISQAPYQVAVIRDRALTCGGSLLSAVWVLTAAHCVYGASQSRFVVRAGSDTFKTGGQLRQVIYVARHGNYDPVTAEHDVAMLRVKGRGFTLSSTARPVSLPSLKSRVPSKFTISGWGTMSESGENAVRQLRATEVQLIPRAICDLQYGDIANITANVICANGPGRDSCLGDSGGPLVSGNVQYGIISYGVGCARYQYPGVHTNVQKYLTWIYSVTKSLSNVNIQG